MNSNSNICDAPSTTECPTTKSDYQTPDYWGLFWHNPSYRHPPGARWESLIPCTSSDDARDSETGASLILHQKSWPRPNEGGRQATQLPDFCPPQTLDDTEGSLGRPPMRPTHFQGRPSFGRIAVCETPPLTIPTCDDSPSSPKHVVALVLRSLAGLTLPRPPEWFTHGGYLYTDNP